MRAAKALASLHICADSPEYSLLDNVINTKIACAGSFMHMLVPKRTATLNIFNIHSSY